MFKRTEEKKPNLIEERKSNKTTIYDEYNIGDTLGGFSGFLQHSKPAKGLDGKSGMMAHVFGENGDDADVITALNLTKYQNVPVKITIWSIKNKDGKLLKYKEEGEDKFPKICQFIGRIHRPTSSMLGLTARFFGEMGGNADAVNELNKTEFYNSLVFVLVQLADDNMLLSEIETYDPTDELIEESVKLTPKELKALEKKQQKFEEADNILVMQNFYGNPKVIELLGSHLDFEKWIKEQPCIVSNRTEDVMAYPIIKNVPIYNFVPLSKSYKDKLENGDLKEEFNIVDVQSFLTQWNKKLLLEFARSKLKEKLGIPQQYFLDPNMVYTWAIKNNLNKLIPMHYTMFLEK